MTAEQRRMRNPPGGGGSDLSTWLFLFAFVYASMQIMPAFLTHEVKDSATSGDVWSVFTPFIVIPVVWKLYFVLRMSVGKYHTGSVRFATALLFVASILYVSGHGMNLSANAVARHLVELEGTAVYRLDYFFDETLGHIFWHGGVLGASISLLVLASHLRPTRTRWLAGAGALFFGFTYFTDGVEGQTSAFLLPGAVLIVGWISFQIPKRPGTILLNPVMFFFLAGYLVAITLFAVWWVWQGGLPEFSALGWI